MNSWRRRPPDEARLFNPAFCSLLLRQASEAYQKERQQGLPFALAFLVPPIVLHQGTRDALPKSTATLMHAWLNENADIRMRFPERAASLVQICREAVGFGIKQGVLTLARDRLKPGVKLSMSKAITAATEDVGDCFRRSGFIGKWFAGSGETSIIMALWGVRP